MTRTLIALVVLAGTAGAAPDKKCYTGTQVADGKIETVLMTRELDRAAAEVRQRTWRQTNPAHEIASTFHVAADGKTFALEFGAVKGSGTLDGEPWKWTAFHEQAEVIGGTMHADGKLAGDTLTVSARIERDGKVAARFEIEAKTFDCAELDKRRAALDDTSRDAAHVCFAGTDDEMVPKGEPVVIEQIFEPKRIQIVESARHRDDRVVLAIEGSSITVTNGHAWKGTGTLGGGHASKHMTAHGKSDLTWSFDADAFDCKDLPTRRAALDAATP